MNILLLMNLISSQKKILLIQEIQQANLASKNDIAGIVKKTEFGKKLIKIDKKVA